MLTPRRLWPLLVIALAALPAAFFSCMTPFAAVAALCATTMRRPTALAIVGAIWVIDQARVFVYLRCAPTSSSIGWGFAMLFVALATVVLLGRPQVTRFARNDAKPLLALIPQFGLVLVAFALEELGYYGFSLGLGGSDLFTSQIVIALGLVNIVWFMAAASVYAVIEQTARVLQGRGFFAHR